MIYLDAAATREALPMSDAIDAMRTAFDTDKQIPVRHQLGSSLFMTGRVQNVAGVKIVSVVAGDPAGLVVVMDADGRPVGIVDGPTLTAIRTGAVCGLATALLARSDASRFAILGAGAMAHDQISAIRAVRPIESVAIWSRNLDRAERLASAVGGVAMETADETIADADIVTTATPSTKPLFGASSLATSVHVNALGAFTPDMVEVPEEFVRNALVVVDDRDAARAEAGDLIQAGRSPDLDMTELLGMEVIPRSQQTLFKSVGIASQDIAAASVALTNAAHRSIGTVLN